MYESLVLYLKEHGIRLENHMFRAVLKSLRYREKGDSVSSSNSWAYVTKLIEHVGGEVTNESKQIEKRYKQELAKYSREVWKYNQERLQEDG